MIPELVQFCCRIEQPGSSKSRLLLVIVYYQLEQGSFEARWLPVSVYLDVLLQRMSK
jgi:hypothetical protein